MLRSSSITLSALFREYDLWNAEVAPCTKASVGVAVRRLHAFFKWMWEQEHKTEARQDFDMEANAIQPRDFSRFRAWLIQGERDGHGGWRRTPVRETTTASYLAALRQLYTYGRQLQPPLIDTNPMDGVKIKRPKPQEPDIWTRDEISDIFRAVRRMRWRDATKRIRWTSIIYAILHAMRINEVTTRKRDDLCPGRRLVFVRACDDVPGKSWQWRVKTATDRVVGISPQYARVLRRLLRTCPWTYPHLSRKVCQSRIAGIGDLTWRQKQQPYTVINREFAAIIAQANVIRLEQNKPMIAVAYPHMGRKTAATSMAVAGVHPKIAATIMGCTPETANRYYVRVQQNQAVAISQTCFTGIGRIR